MSAKMCEPTTANDVADPCRHDVRVLLKQQGNGVAVGIGAADNTIAWKTQLCFSGPNWGAH